MFLNSHNSKPNPNVNKRMVGGSSEAHLKLYGLNKRSHPIDCFKSFMPLTLEELLDVFEQNSCYLTIE